MLIFTKKMKVYDIVIIGGGPIGLACGLEAKNAGLSYLILEKGTLVNSLYNYPTNMTFFSTSERLEIGNIPFVSNNAKPTRNEALEYYRRVAESQNLNIKLFETVLNIENQEDTLSLEKNTEGYAITTNKGKYEAKHIILASGFYDIPNKLNIKGENLPKVTHYYKEPHFYFKQKVVVVGANNSAVDAALETWRKGADVTMIIRNDEVGERVKYWARPDIVNRIKEGSIKAFFNSELLEIRENEVDIKNVELSIKNRDAVTTIENDYVIAATGYQPNFNFLRKIGLELSKNDKLHPTYNTETQESNLPNVYLAGVICGGMDTHVWFIENSRIHAEKIVKDILSKV
jgi:thioredoxin reductase (NADPH)